MPIQKNVILLIGLITLAYVTIILLAPKNVADYTIADTEYWRETENRLLLKSSFNYNDKDSILSFPKTLGNWTSFDYRYPEFVYKQLNADILISRGYRKDNKNIIWIDIINSKTGESFHKQKICVEGAGWRIDNETIDEFNIAKPPNLFTRLKVNRLDISKGKNRQIMVYWFMFKKFGFNDSVVMIRLSSPIKNNSVETFDNLKSFVEGQLFQTMYETKEPEETNIEYIIKRYGNKGVIAIILILLAPIGIIFTGIRMKNEK